MEPLDPEETGGGRDPLAVVEVLWARRPLVAVGALAVLGGSAFCFVSGETLPVGLLPVISSSLHSSLSATGLLVTVYALVVVVVSAPLTHLTRHIPRRYLLSGLLGVYVVATLAAAAAPGYWWLMAARVVTALSQAVFWSIAPVTAAGLFPPEKRGRAVAGVLVGGPLGILVGLPAGTWIGQQAGWRVPFVVLSGLGLAGVAAVALLVPTTKPSESQAAAGTGPNARRYWMLVATTGPGHCRDFHRLHLRQRLPHQGERAPCGRCPGGAIAGRARLLIRTGLHRTALEPPTAGGNGWPRWPPGRLAARVVLLWDHRRCGGGPAGARELWRGQRRNIYADTRPRGGAPQHRHRFGLVLGFLQRRHRLWAGDRWARAVWSRAAQHAPSRRAAGRPGLGGGPQRTPRWQGRT